tara:strand:+ start:245 stop:598 length:354 start_codon:yes stop_codon:yes gene_type:complete
MTKNVMTQKDRFHLQKLLESVLEEHGEFVRYQDGWNDKRVARECGCESKIVQNTRARTFGRLYRQTPGPKTSNRIVELEGQVAQLQAQMAAVLEAITVRDQDLFQPEKSNGEFHDAT